MTKEIHLEHFRRRLQDVDKQIEAARERLEQGPTRDKVAAAGNLAGLEDRRREIEAELKRLEQAKEEDWPEIYAAVEDGLDNIMTSIARWIVEH